MIVRADLDRPVPGIGDEQRDLLEATAAARDVRVSVIEATSGEPLERYATVLGRGLFAAAYLQIGLGRVPE